MCFRPPSAQKIEKVCPSCNAVNDGAAQTCTQCGVELPTLPPPPGQSSGAPDFISSPPPGQPGGVTPPKAPPAPPKMPPAVPPKK